MAVWAYVFLPETSGYALEDIKYLYEKDVIVRALEDAPGGKIFIRGRHSTPVAELRRQAEGLEKDNVSVGDEDGKMGVQQIDDVDVEKRKTPSRPVTPI